MVLGRICLVFFLLASACAPRQTSFTRLPAESAGWNNCRKTSFAEFQGLANEGRVADLCFAAQVYSNVDQLILVSPSFRKDDVYPEGIWVKTPKLSNRGTLGNLAEGEQIYVKGTLDFGDACWEKAKLGFTLICAPEPHVVRLFGAQIRTH